MAFQVRPDGLIDVDTPLGPMPMAPEVATSLGWGGPEQITPPLPLSQAPGAMAQAAPGERVPLGITAVVDEQAAAQRQDPATLLPPTAAQSGQATAAPTATPEQPQGPSYLDLARSVPTYSEASSTTRRTSAPITGNNRAALDSAVQTQLAGHEANVRAQMAEADLQTTQANMMAEQARQQLERDKARAAEGARKMSELRNQRELRRMAIPQEIDPNGWDTTGGPARVLAALGVMLGGISQGISGRANPGSAIVDQLVAQHVQAERDKAELARQGVADIDSELIRLEGIYGDPVLAQKQLELDAYQALLNETQAQVQKTQSDQVKAAGTVAIGELGEKIALLQNEWDGRAGEVVTQSQVQGEDPTSQQRRLFAAAEMDAAKTDPFAAMTPNDRRKAMALRVSLPGGGYAWAKDSKNADEAQQIVDAVEGYKANVMRIKQIMKSGANLNKAGKEYGELKQLVQDNVVMIKNIEQLGALVGGDWDIVNPLSGKDAANWTNLDAQTEAGLDSAVRSYDAKLERVYRRLTRDYSGLEPLTAGGDKRPGQRATFGAR